MREEGVGKQRRSVHCSHKHYVKQGYSCSYNKNHTFSTPVYIHINNSTAYLFILFNINYFKTTHFFKNGSVKVGKRGPQIKELLCPFHPTALNRHNSGANIDGPKIDLGGLRSENYNFWTGNSRQKKVSIASQNKKKIDKQITTNSSHLNLTIRMVILLRTVFLHFL